MMITILTHPFQMLLVSMVLTRLVRLALSGAGDHGFPVHAREHRLAA